MLNLFTRIDRLLKANLNHMLDQVEDPERMLAQLIRDLDAGLCEARSQVAGAMAAEKRLAARLRDHQARRDGWAARAGAALDSGQEELAREALARKLDEQRIVTELETVRGQAAQAVARLRGQLQALEGRRAEALRRRSELVARQRTAQAQRSLNQTLSRCRAGLELRERFADLEERIADAQARAEAEAELMDQSGAQAQSFRDLETATQVERELAALKARRAAGD